MVEEGERGRVTHATYEEWLNDYKRAATNGHDSSGRDIFDLLHEKLRGATVGLMFDGLFSDRRLAEEALTWFLARGYDRDSSWIHPTVPLLHVGREFVVDSAEAFRSEVRVAERAFGGAEDFEWDFDPYDGHPGTGPPLRRREPRLLNGSVGGAKSRPPMDAG